MAGIWYRRLLAIAVALQLFSCSPKYYAPNAHNVALLRHGGDGAIVVSNGNHRTDVQGSYAPRDGLALLLTASRYHPLDDEEGDGGRGRLVELGVGSFVPFAHRGLMQIAVVAGAGDLENHFHLAVGDGTSTGGALESRLLRLGMQLAAGYRGRYLESALALRVSQVRYFDVSGSLYFSGQDQVAYLRNVPGQWFAEPAWTLRLGYESLKLQAQLGRAINLTSAAFPADEVYLALGLSWQFHLSGQD